MKITRRQFLKAVGGSAATLAGIAGYARFVEPRWLDISHEIVDFGGQATGRIVHISDIHESPQVPMDFIEEGFAAALALKPDIICLTGDFITRRIHDRIAYRAALSTLADAAPTFACLGNHDGGRWAGRHGGYATPDAVADILGESGAVILSDESQMIAVGDANVRLIGIGDLWSQPLNLERAFDFSQDEKTPRIVLGHNPDLKDSIVSYDWDLLLAGHTHGGQVRLPILGTPFGSVRDRRFLEGLHQWSGRRLYVNRGLGNLRGVRFYCRPQITAIDVKA